MLIWIRYINNLDAVAVECTPASSPQGFMKLDHTKTPFCLWNRLIFTRDCHNLRVQFGSKFCWGCLQRISDCFFRLVLIKNRWRSELRSPFLHLVFNVNHLNWKYVISSRLCVMIFGNSGQLVDFCCVLHNLSRYTTAIRLCCSICQRTLFAYNELIKEGKDKSSHLKLKETWN